MPDDFNPLTRDESIASGLRRPVPGRPFPKMPAGFLLRVGCPRNYAMSRLAFKMLRQLEKQKRPLTVADLACVLHRIGVEMAWGLPASEANDLLRTVGEAFKCDAVVHATAPDKTNDH